MTIYKNPSYSTQERVADLLSQMTLEETIAQLGAQWLLLDENGDHSERELEMTSSHEQKTVKEKLKYGLGQITRPLGTHVVTPEQGVQA
ncbi:glycoside hydrolase family 3 N-terminal domain-containing protein, partial [Vibrio campbellii]